jgi:hypothetical protein
LPIPPILWRPPRAVVAAAVAGAFACHLESRQKAVKSGADGEYIEGGQSAGAADDDDDEASGSANQDGGNAGGVGASDVQIAIRSGRARRASAVQVGKLALSGLENLKFCFRVFREGLIESSPRALLFPARSPGRWRRRWPPRAPTVRYAA